MKKNDRTDRRPSRLIMPVSFALAVFAILVIDFLLVGFIVFRLDRLGILRADNAGAGDPFILLLPVFVLASLVIGLGMAAMIGTVPVRVFHGLQQGMSELAAGHFEARLKLGGGRLGEDVSKSFNTLAAELQNTEMLRSDFVNNFSHEFKTPIVSIYGFAQLLNQGKLSPEEQRESLRIIEEESARLSTLATNILNLTKVENQEILTGVRSFNLAEQLRTSLLLLEQKWTEKNLELDLNFPELELQGNEELLKEVWINLLDNAIKFSPEGDEIAVRLSREKEFLLVEIENHGAEIDSAEQEKIFRKFYQADASHASAGNGIGLAVAQRVVELHGGRISVSSNAYRTVFTVRLPVEQPA